MRSSSATLTKAYARKVLIGASIALALFLLLPERTIVYRSVKDGSHDPRSWSQSESRVLASHLKIGFYFVRPPEYIISDDTAYLRVMTVDRMSLFMAVNKREEIWTPERLQHVVSQHPELQEHMQQPQPGQFVVNWVH
jgi:hypothetical protein